VSSQTGLNTAFAVQCLEGNGWVMERALTNFEELKARHDNVFAAPGRIADQCLYLGFYPSRGVHALIRSPPLGLGAFFICFSIPFPSRHASSPIPIQSCHNTSYNTMLPSLPSQLHSQSTPCMDILQPPFPSLVILSTRNLNRGILLPVARLIVNCKSTRCT